MIQQLLGGCGVVPGVTVTEAHKQASLQAIGYLCADIADSLLTPHASQILEAVVGRWGGLSFSAGDDVYRGCR